MKIRRPCGKKTVSAQVDEQGYYSLPGMKISTIRLNSFFRTRCEIHYEDEEKQMKDQLCSNKDLLHR